MSTELVYVLLAVATLRLVSTEGAPFASLTSAEDVKIALPTARGLPSDAWRPAILSICAPGLHPESAPCRGIENLIHAEELLYQDFRIRLPRFVDPDHKRIYLKVLQHEQHAWHRGRVIDNYGYFLNQRGQNLIYANVTYDFYPIPGVWRPDACMGSQADKHINSFRPWQGDKDSAPAAIFVASPDDYAFQHFIDRVAVMLAQTRHLTTTLGGGWSYLTSVRVRKDIVQRLWEMLIPGFNGSTLLPVGFGRTTVDLRLFLYPCQAPLIHPYNHQLVSELITEAAGFDPRVTEPLASRPLVLFLARFGTRNWDNQEECRRAIERLIQDRGRGEQLEVFQAEEYPTVQSLVALGRRVKLMVGVHGGAFYNLVFMQPGTGLVEVCPVAPDETKSRCGAMFWEMSGIRNMHYWSVVATNSTPRWEVQHVDCSLVVHAVRDALENLENLPSPLEAFHQGTKFMRRR